MLRYKTETRPGLVALDDIRPGNGAGQFLQPRSPHGVPLLWTQSDPRQYENQSVKCSSRTVFELKTVRSRLTEETV